MPPLVMFDLDDTLAESKQALTPHMATLLSKLLAKTRVAIISGGGLPQFLTQIVNHLPENAKLSNLYLITASGGTLHEWREGTWHKVYEELLTPAEAARIEHVALEVVGSSELVDLRAKPYGKRVENRGSSVAFSMFGQEAPLEVKRAWDPDKSKRSKLQQALALRLPEYEVMMGGASTLDITKKGVDKAYGITKIADYLKLPIHEMMYVGDELVPGGNDEPALRTSIKPHLVKDPSETAFFIHALVGTAD